jgi:hypothetical protein
MPVPTAIEQAKRPLPAFDFHWDSETEILAGRHALPVPEGETAIAWELEGPDGAVVVLETVGGTLCGIEVVVWPDVERAPSLVAPHDAPAARVGLTPPKHAKVGVVEIETAISAAAPQSETLIHLSLGAPRTRSVRLAENVIVDLDAEGRLAGLWLQNLPLFTQGG